jgi:hypothetical protein
MTTELPVRSNTSEPSPCTVCKTYSYDGPKESLQGFPIASSERTSGIRKPEDIERSAAGGCELCQVIISGLQAWGPAGFFDLADILIYTSEASLTVQVFPQGMNCPLLEFFCLPGEWIARTVTLDLNNQPSREHYKSCGSFKPNLTKFQVLSPPRLSSGQRRSCRFCRPQSNLWIKQKHG